MRMVPAAAAATLVIISISAQQPAAQQRAAQQRPEDAVMAVYRLLEKADRDGDLLAQLRLQDRKTRDETGADVRERVSQGGLQSTPTLRYQSTAVRVLKDRAVIAGNIVGAGQYSSNHHLIEFVLEEGEWKVAAELLSDTAFDRSAIYAVVPPADGSFTRAGSQWPGIPVAANNTKRFKDQDLPWKMQATRDESFLYVRFGSAAVLPVPGSEVQKEEGQQFVKTGAPESPPSMRIKIGGREFGLQIASVIQSESTFDDKGKANSIRYFVQYTFTLRSQADQDIFSSDTSGSIVRLLSVQDKFMDLKIPWLCLGPDGKAPVDVELNDANIPGRILPYRIAPWR